MSESNMSIDRYKKAKDEADTAIKSMVNNQEKIKDETEYALIHLKEYINLYRLQFNHLSTTRRKDAICKKILQLFPKADPNRINSFLRKKLVFGYMDYFCVFVPLIIYFIFIIARKVTQDLTDAIGITLLSTCGVVFILSFIVTECSLIRLYPLYKIKESKK